MKVLLAVLILAALCMAGWRQPFKEHFVALTGAATPTPPPTSTRREPPPSGIIYSPKPTPWRPMSTTLDAPRGRRH